MHETNCITIRELEIPTASLGKVHNTVHVFEAGNWDTLTLAFQNFRDNFHKFIITHLDPVTRLSTSVACWSKGNSSWQLKLCSCECHEYEVCGSHHAKAVLNLSDNHEGSTYICWIMLW